MAKLTVSSLQQMKRDGQKIMAAVCYDYQLSRICDRAGVHLISAGDSVGYTNFGQLTRYGTTMDEMVIVCRAVARGAQNAVVNGDLPFGPVQEGYKAAVKAAIRLIQEGEVDTVKLDNAAANMDAVKAITNAGIPLWPQFGFSPQSSMAIGEFTARTEDMVARRREQIVREAVALEEAGASLLDLTGVTPEIYAEVAKTVKIPVLGGQATAAADGRIFTNFQLRSSTVDQESGPNNIGRFVFDYVSRTMENVKLSKF
jgi:3-methyl-2-oxobutanoate hydroxymethyltransferase